MNRPDWRQLSMRDHFVREWDGVTACGRDSLEGDLNQTVDWDLVTCLLCLINKGEGDD